MKLDDAISGLLSGVQQARVAADFQSIQTAELYAKNALLENFSIPRFRLDNVEIVLPLAIAGGASGEGGTVPKLDVKAFGNASYSLILSSFGIGSLAAVQSRNLRSEIFKLVDMVSQQLGKENLAKILQDYANKVAKLAFEIVQPKFEGQEREAKFEELVKVLQSELRQYFEIPLQASTEVIVDAAHLREIPQANLLSIKINIREDAVEWHRLEENGKVVRKLLPTD